jgi:hypothetical protein
MASASGPLRDEVVDKLVLEYLKKRKWVPRRARPFPLVAARV